MDAQERLLWWEAFSERVVSIFGKNTFTEDELTKEFYTRLYIECGDLFRNDDGCINLDLFWNEELRDWLLKKKK